MLPISSATRRARLIAATRRGWVTATALLSPSSPLSSRNWGSWVLLPLPVSPTSTSTCVARSSRSSASRASQMGSFWRSSSSAPQRALRASQSGTGGGPAVRCFFLRGCSLAADIEAGTVDEITTELYRARARARR